MPLPGNGATKRVIAGVVLAVLIGLATQVLVNTNRLSVLETQMTTIERGLETNRVENNRAHEKIGDQLTEVLREVGKK
jgi:uncharacterized membrane protein YraQ (UPF0718 family)